MYVCGACRSYLFAGYRAIEQNMWRLRENIYTFHTRVQVVSLKPILLALFDTPPYAPLALSPLHRRTYQLMYICCCIVTLLVIENAL